MAQREQIEQAIAHMEAQRAELGDAVVEASLAALREKLAALEEQDEPAAEALAGERKQVTVMFADISGFTPLSEKMDPEAVRDLVNACFEHLVPIVEKYEGTVDKFMGDNIMALFGAPAAHENDPERALRAALEMKQALAEFSAGHGVELDLHFGINTGLAIAGGLGTRERQEYSVMGDAVNLAARLEDLSQRGEILAGPDTYRLTAPLFEFEALAPVRVKGKAELVPVYRLLRAEAMPRRAGELETRGISSPLVGRDEEFGSAQGCIARLLDGRGGILAVLGEAGVGKSRLVAEMREQTLQILAKVWKPSQGSQRWSTPRWLEGRSLSYGQTISYWPFQEILWSYASITEEDSEKQAWDKLESRVHDLFAEDTAEILPYLATLLSLEVKDHYAERVKHLDGEAMGRQVYLASRRFFERLAGKRPLVVVFEDLHWVDESSSLLLEHLLPLVERVPLLICGVGRPYRQTPAAHLREVASQEFPECYTEIRLTPLSQADSAQLVGNLLEIEHLPSRTRETIVSKAGGNPFFLEETIRSLIDAGAVVREPSTGRWQPTAHIETTAIPDTIQGVIMARVDRLDEEVRQVLRTASVIGRSFLYRVLRAIEEGDLQLDQHLTELEAIEFIRKKQQLPELEYIFKHALAQEATYESILLQRRHALHARVGGAIEALFPDRLEEFYGLLAYHYARAEDWEKAQDYLLKAGDQAGRVAADAEALAHYQQAMAAYGRAFGHEWDPQQRAALERKMGEALLRRGEHEQALEHLERALACLDKPLPTSPWGVRLAILREVAQQASYHLLPRLFLKPIGGPISPAVEEAVHAYESAAWIEGFRNPERFLLISIKTLNLSEHSGFSDGVATGSAGLGMCLDFVPLFWLAWRYHRRAVALVEQRQRPDLAYVAYFCMAWHKAYQGKLDEAIEFARRSAEAFRATGDLHRWGFSAYQVVLILTYQGALSQALVHCRELIRLGQEAADLQALCWGLSAQGFVQQRLGHFGEADAASQEAFELAQAIPDQAFCISTAADLGRCHLRRGNLEGALAAFDTSLGFYAPNLGGDSYPSLRNGLAEAYLFASEQAGEAERGGWLRKARRACKDALRQGKAFRPGLPEAMRLQGTYEWFRGRPAAAQKWWKRGLTLAEEMGQRYDEGVAHLEMGRRLGDRAHLERAEAILAEVGAEWDLARARETLEGM